MSKEQLQSFAIAPLSAKRSKKKNKRQILPFVDLAFCKSDLEDLIQLFQNYLQDVEIFIDDQRILDGERLAQFEDTYQAKSFLARGYWPVAKERDSQDERLLIELKMNKAVATLASWNTIGKSEFIMQIRKRFLSRNIFAQQLLAWIMIGFFVSPVFSAVSFVERQPFDSISQILKSIIELIAGILSMVAFVWLFSLIMKWLKLETRISLFPGKTTTIQIHYRFHMLVRLMIALILLIVTEGLIGLIVIGFRVLWR